MGETGRSGGFHLVAPTLPISRERDSQFSLPWREGVRRRGNSLSPSPNLSRSAELTAEAFKGEGFV